jgi:hypothetical protein
LLYWLQGASLGTLPSLQIARQGHNHAVALMDVRAAKIDPDAMLRLLHKDEYVYDAVISGTSVTIFCTPAKNV